MQVIISNDIEIINPSDKIIEYCRKRLVIANPDYEKKFRMRLWLGNTPEKLWMFARDGDKYILPYGVLREIYQLIDGSDIKTDFPRKRKIDYKCNVPLYPYQTEAVDALESAKFGILESKAGSGKTQIGIALIGRLGCKTLWITHTADLLKQSRERAALYMDSSLFGTITAGKIDIGDSITFATVQTLAKQDMNQFRNTWDCVIVDECHHCCGTPSSLSQFGKVIGSLACRHKYGLSATVHRADGLTRTIFNYLGEVVYKVPDDAIADKVMTVTVREIQTGVPISEQCLDTDGTLIHSSLITYLTKTVRRNFQITNALIENAEHFNLILSDRLEHLKTLMALLPDELREQSVMIDGTMTTKAAKAERDRAIEDMRQGNKHFLFASYKLAKEGLDIPRLDRLYLTTPQKDFAVIVQSVGRVARTFSNKENPICYDYVDDIDYLKNAFKKRCRHYRKSGCQIERSDE